MNDKQLDSWLNPEFWHEIYLEAVNWGVRAFPQILMIFVLAFVLLNALQFLCSRIEKHALAGDSSGATRREEQKRAETLIGIVRAAGKLVIWGLIGVSLLMQVGVDVAPLIAGAGVLGLAVGFGAQEFVRDVISGFFLLLENQIRNGDVAVINGTGGLVESISLRTIQLRDLSGTVHIFQNGKISTLSNMTKTWSAMVFDIRVPYKEDTDRVGAIMKEVADEMQADSLFGAKILEPMELFGVDKFDESAVIVKARLKTVPIEQWNVGREFNRRLKLALDKEGIEIPLPQRTLSWARGSAPVAISQTKVAE